MEEFFISVGSIIVAAFVFYYVIKWAVRKAIVEAKVHEDAYTKEVVDDAMFLEISERINGTDGLGTDMFNGLSKEQKDLFKPRFKEISKPFSRLYFQAPEDRGREIAQIKELLDKLQRDIDALRNQ